MTGSLFLSLYFLTSELRCCLSEVREGVLACFFFLCFTGSSLSGRASANCLAATSLYSSSPSIAFFSHVTEQIFDIRRKSRSTPSVSS